MVNQDGEQLGDALVNVFHSEELASLIALSETADPAAARQQVDADTVAAAIIIPAGFTRSIIPAAGATPTGEVVSIELYTNPTRPTSVGVIKTILDEFMSQVEVGRVGGQVAVTQLIERGLIRPQDAPLRHRRRAGRAPGGRGGTARRSS